MRIPELVERAQASARWASTPAGVLWLSTLRWPHQNDRGWRATKEAGALLAGLRRLYWISEDMAVLVEHAAKSMPDEPLFATDLPSEFGGAFLQRPRPVLLIPESGKDRFTADLLGWLWARVRYVDAEGVLLGAIYDMTDGGHYLVPPVMDFIRFGERPLDLHSSLRNDDDVHRRVEPRAAWRLFQQTIARVRPAELDRATRRRAQKDGQPLPEISVVTLRRTADAGTGLGSSVEWSRRWTVSGHWRNQPFGPARGLVRQVWIEEYVKGPPDKPIVPNHVVGALVR